MTNRHDKKGENRGREGGPVNEAAFRQAPFPYQYLDEKARIIDVNRAWLEELGYHRDEVEGEPFTNFLKDGTVRKFEDWFFPAAQERRPSKIDLELEKGDDTSITVLYGEKRSFDDEGDFLRTRGIFHNITERKEYEENLELQKDLFDSIMELTPDLVYFKDAEYRFERVGEGYTELMDLTEEEMVGKTAEDFWPNADEIMKDEERALNGDPVIGREREVTLPSGEKRWYSIYKFPRRDSNGNVVGFLGMDRDITERKQAIEKLKQSEEKYKNLFYESPIGVIYYDAEGIIRDCNEKFVEILGSSKEALEGLDMVEDLENQEVIDAVKRSLTEGEGEYRGLYSAVTGEKTVSVSAKFKGLQGDRGEFDGGIGLIEDLSEQKRVEKELLETNERLKRSRERYQTYFEKSGDAIFILGMKGERYGEILEANTTAVEQTGYSREELLGMNLLDDLALGSPVEMDSEAVREAISNGETVSFTERKERKDGSVYWTEVVVTPIRHEGQKANLSINRDITRRKELEKAQRLFSSSLNQAALEVYWITPKGKFVYVNQKVQEKLGYSREELEDMYVWDVDPNPEHAGETREERWKKLKEQEVIHFETDHKTKEGEIYPVSVTSHYIEHGGKEYEFAFVRDITDRKESKLKLLHSEARLRQSFVELAETTSRVLGVRDPYTQKHELEVGRLAKEAGKRLGLSEEKCLGLYLGGVLHDIGKIAIPETILTKPGELKDVEWKLIKSHPIVGYEQILKDTNFPWPVAEMTLHHHERLDGSGYPHGLEGEELTREVRILGVVDVVEAMSTRRPYRPARSREHTLKIIEDGKGGKFDPKVVELLFEMIEEGEIEFGKAS